MELDRGIEELALPLLVALLDGGKTLEYDRDACRAGHLPNPLRTPAASTHHGTAIWTSEVLPRHTISDLYEKNGR